jgi:hypothetical protein
MLNILSELVLRASNDLDLFGKFSYKTSMLLEESTFSDINPIFAILHEPIYCQGYWAHPFN